MLEQNWSSHRSAPFRDLINMDQALIYIKQRLDKLIREISDRKTKTLGLTYYNLNRFIRDVYQIGAMSGNAFLDTTVRSSFYNLSERSVRLDVLSRLNEFIKKIEQYQPIDSEDVDSLRKRLAALEGQTSSELKENETDTSLESSVFVIMPFRPELNDVWKGGIQRAAQTEGFHPIRVDMINRSTNINDDIVDSIKKCHLAIVDVTDNNPNVMFELGFVLAINKPNIIISQSTDFLPFDIRNIRTIVYSNTWSGIEELRGKIQEFLKEFSSNKKGQKKRSATKKTAVKIKAVSGTGKKKAR